MMRLVRTLKWALMLFSLVAVAGAVLIATDGMVDHVHNSAVALVLGARVYADGKPSPDLKGRLDKAIDLYRQGMFSTVIVSGGRTGAGGLNEARVMRDYLVTNDIPASAIVIDEMGTDTAASAKNSAIIMRAHGYRNILVITQYFHIPRTRMALRANGIGEIYSAHATYYGLSDIYSTIREVIAIPAYLASGKGV